LELRSWNRHGMILYVDLGRVCQSVCTYVVSEWGLSDRGSGYIWGRRIGDLYSPECRRLRLGEFYTFYVRVLLYSVWNKEPGMSDSSVTSCKFKWEQRVVHLGEFKLMGVCVHCSLEGVVPLCYLVLMFYWRTKGMASLAVQQRIVFRQIVPKRWEFFSTTPIG
jgi:hypothetical protein